MHAFDSEEHARGWVKPVKRRTAAEIKALIAEKQREVASLELELFNLQQGPRLEAIVQIRNIVRAHQLTLEEICGSSRKLRGQEASARSAR